MSQKTEKATPYKLKKVREKGQVSKSIELVSCTVVFVLMLTISMQWPLLLAEIKQMMIHLFYLTGHIHLTHDNAIKLQHLLSSKLLIIWLPTAIIGCMIVILTTILQTGIVWSIHPLRPDFKKLHFNQGLKRLFSAKLFVDAGKYSLKILLVFSLMGISFKHELPKITYFIQLLPSDCFNQFMKLAFKLSLQLILILYATTLIDVLYSRWRFMKEHRMTKQEINDEYRQREGDPKIKAKIKQLQKQLRQKVASLEKVKQADAVITNPTHIAIALQYKRKLMPAPKVICKVQGEMVKQVKAIATRHQIPIIENKPFARALFATVELNQWISREHFPIAAVIFREIYMKKGIWV